MSLNSQGRQRIVLRMTNGILNDSNVSLLFVTQPKMLFCRSKMTTNFKSFANTLTIDDCDQPRPFKINILKSKFDHIQVK